MPVRGGLVWLNPLWWIGRGNSGSSQMKRWGGAVLIGFGAVIVSVLAMRAGFIENRMLFPTVGGLAALLWIKSTKPQKS